MPSETKNLRRAPQQQRAGDRVEQLLEAAAIVMAESGYDAATMTEIAQRAEASIGTVYQYFPNKQAVVLALRNRYGEEMSARLIEIEAVAAACSIPEIADRLIENTREFVDRHPAYFQLLDVPLPRGRNQEARMRLRVRIGAIIRKHRPTISEEDAWLVASIIVQVIKSMNPLYVKASSQERIALVREYKLLLTSYIERHVSA